LTPDSLLMFADDGELPVILVAEIAERNPALLSK
jgi:hypothetical protein